MSRPPYLGRSLLRLLLLLPLLYQVLLVGVFLGAGIAVDGHPAGLAALGGVAGLLFLFLCARSGMTLVLHSYPEKEDAPETAAADGGRPVREGVMPDRFFVRYQPVIVASLWTLPVALVALMFPPGESGSVFGTFVSLFTLAHLPSSILTIVVTMFSVPSPWMFLGPPLAIYAAYGLGMAWGFRRLRAPRTALRGQFVAGIVSVAFLLAIVWRMEVLTEGLVGGRPEDAWMPDRFYIENYRPHREGNRLVKVAKPTLTITENHPRLDGATAAYPVYAAAAQAIYKNLKDYEVEGRVVASTTPRAYTRLIEGKADLIFAAHPSPEQIAAAREKGLVFNLTPIGREAFVFFVHKDNPVETLSTDQIRAIYTKKIRNWREVGGRGKKIVPFQRPKGSGSQTAMEHKVMRGEPLPEPLREEFAQAMGGIIRRVASWRNTSEAIGYSFRVFATQMSPDRQIRLLRIDGVAPGPATIRTGEYPYTVDVFAVTVSPASPAGADGATGSVPSATAPNPHVQELVDWFLGPQGQRLIEETGYVGLAPVQ
ncbi:phosphate ABC transporter substrate-binding protein [Opitutaceae bacterium TAV5]|nr:phosphate ABC transporter substrate-binding protein [Opitutaceae bacterium TAV5]